MQHINLYTDDFRPKKVILPLEQMILLPAVALLILVGLSLLLNSNLEETKQELMQLEAKNANMQAHVKKLEEQAKRQRKDDSLVAANRRLSKTVQARQQMMEMLDTVVVKDDEGFSNILLSLSRQQIDGLWLKEIHVAASGQDMRLEGTTDSAKSVPAYLQKLRQETSFIGRTFTLFELDQHPDKSSQLNFSLRSEVSKAKPAMLVKRFEASKKGAHSEQKLQQNPLQGGQQ